MRLAFQIKMHGLAPPDAGQHSPEPVTRARSAQLSALRLGRLVLENFRVDNKVTSDG